MKRAVLDLGFRRFATAPRLVFISLGVSVLFGPSPSQAQWGVNGAPVCTAAGDQTTPAIVPDGGGGAIITWPDRRNSTDWNIYAQHVLASGAADPAWPLNGLAVCLAVKDQQSPRIVTDGAGGAIISWQDFRGTSSYIYAQHVLLAGSVDPAWPVDGLVVGIAGGDPSLTLTPAMASDGAGGAIITWEQWTLPMSNVVFRHVLANGTLDPAWNHALCSLSNVSRIDPDIISDGMGGAIIAWGQSSVGWSVFAIHVLASGLLDLGWNPPCGRLLTSGPTHSQWHPRIETDGSGGAYVAWEDVYWTPTRLYAQHVLASGSLNPGWTTNGLLFCNTVGNPDRLRMVHGTVGVFVAWEDYRTGWRGVYAQRLLVSGLVDPNWPVNGVELSGRGESPEMISDGEDGALVTWWDSRWYLDIFAQHLPGTGSIPIDPSWPTQGLEVSPLSDYAHMYPTIASDSANGAIVTWQQTDPSGVLWDIYAQRVYASGGLATVPPGQTARLGVFAPHPNPMHAKTAVRFSLPTSQRVSMRVYNVTGELVRVLSTDEPYPAGDHSLIWDGARESGAPAPPGVYFIRTSTELGKVTRRVTILR